ncbi:hypothetical protein [Chitiniphilus eburneus]|uniref:Uncharacterized protein n=1 Tax=Chitiniphilus eburneus TaxID=2571148 RepID=A0A4U0P9H9_9NEIS|nr:hypothetical protein [Chitiniphilus eburneus]TJZ64257.1 hypothetical protein FAZ21_19280 [Chitiniphilus eburneus]
MAAFASPVGAAGVDAWLEKNNLVAGHAGPVFDQAERTEAAVWLRQVNAEHRLMFTIGSNEETASW